MPHLNSVGVHFVRPAHVLMFRERRHLLSNVLRDSIVRAFRHMCRCLEIHAFNTFHSSCFLSKCPIIQRLGKTDKYNYRRRVRRHLNADNLMFLPRLSSPCVAR